MSDNIVYLHETTTGEIPIKRVIDGIPEDLDLLFVAGRREDGTLYLSTNTSNAERLALLILQAQKTMLEELE